MNDYIFNPFVPVPEQIEFLIGLLGDGPVQGLEQEPWDWSLILSYEVFPEWMSEKGYENCHEIGRAAGPFMPAGCQADHESGMVYWYAPTEALRDAGARALVYWVMAEREAYITRDGTLEA